MTIIYYVLRPSGLAGLHWAILLLHVASAGVLGGPLHRDSAGCEHPAHTASLTCQKSSRPRVSALAGSLFWPLRDPGVKVKTASSLEGWAQDSTGHSAHSAVALEQVPGQLRFRGEETDAMSQRELQPMQMGMELSVLIVGHS